MNMIWQPLARRAMRICLAWWLAASAQAAYQDDIGYTLLKAELGGSMPSGAGVNVTHVEAPEVATNFMPSITDAEFAGKTIVQASPGGPTPSGHATLVAQYFYGTN